MLGYGRDAPIIGVTTSDRFTPAWPFLALSIRLQGARPVRITPASVVELDALDGLLIGGGDDLGAELYNGQPMIDAKIDPLRDEMELSLLSRFWHSPAPILGVCRGAQIMNVYRGGTLHGDIYQVYQMAPKMRTVLPKKRVEIVEGSRLADILDLDQVTVNALHHQSVDNTGDGIGVAACDQAGIVQAIEGWGGSFRIGVQWHPEFLFYKAAHRRLFRSFVQCAHEVRPAMRELSIDDGEAVS